MDGLRNQFLLDPEVAFLNHGSFGAAPGPVFESYQRWQRELERQPVEFLDRRAANLLAESRERLARYVGAGPDDLVYVLNATVAVNIVARSLDLGPGDEVLTGDHEYGACERTWRFLARKRGFGLKVQPLPVPVRDPQEVLDELWKGVNDRTRLIFLSHITSPTALILPVEALCRRARQQGILTLIDGAHAPGQVPLDLKSLDPDFYAGNLHKWACAPKGAGFLYARSEVQHLLEPLVVSWGWESEKPGPSRFIDWHQGWGTRDLAAFLAVPAALDFMQDHDWDTVREASHQLLRETQARVTALTGLAPLHPDSPTWFRQMAANPLPMDSDLDILKGQLYEKYRVEIPLFEWNGYKLIRTSIQGYNARADVDRLLEALTGLL